MPLASSFRSLQDYDHLRHTLPLRSTPTIYRLVVGERLPSPAPASARPSSWPRSRMIRKRAQSRPAILLLSDGDLIPPMMTNGSRGVQEAKGEGVSACAHTVGIGAPDHAETIPIGRDILQFDGEPVYTKLQEARLEDIARRTDGIYLAAQRKQYPLGTIVQHLLDADALREDPQSESGIPLPRLRYVWFLLPATLGLFLTLCSDALEGRLAVKPTAAAPGCPDAR